MPTEFPYPPADGAWSHCIPIAWCNGIFLAILVSEVRSCSYEDILRGVQRICRACRKSYMACRKTELLALRRRNESPLVSKKMFGRHFLPSENGACPYSRAFFRFLATFLSAQFLGGSRREIRCLNRNEGAENAVVLLLLSLGLVCFQNVRFSWFLIFTL